MPINLRNFEAKKATSVCITNEIKCENFCRIGSDQLLLVWGNSRPWPTHPTILSWQEYTILRL